jgi:hypothetical protein
VGWGWWHPHGWGKNACSLPPSHAPQEGLAPKVARLRQDVRQAPDGACVFVCECVCARTCTCWCVVGEGRQAASPTVGTPPPGATGACGPRGPGAAAQAARGRGPAGAAPAPLERLRERQRLLVPLPPARSRSPQEEGVKAATKKAYGPLLKAANGDDAAREKAVREAMAALVKMKGVGPATASFYLVLADASCPLMSDQALAAATGNHKAKYTEKART